ncbi:MAG: maltose alpha-D-glucosyltransferase [Anaerolineales bacterium]|nr:maltose alpha-D-glucosyltransferase [Anaerolineales bacterium]
MKENLLWYKDAVFYEVYVRAYRDSNADGHGDLRGLIEKLDYIQELGVDCIWLLPIYPSPLEDDGYDIADYYGIHPDYGNLDDFKTLVEAAHSRGLRLIADLVVNHTSDQHPWFQAARKDPDSPYRDYYVWSDTDEKYQQARIIFLDTEQSNWTWDEQAGQYFWHRFYSSQPDLNFDNPAVQEEMFKIARFWLDLGIDGFRVDAVPYLFEREGTNCENLPETHTYLKALRSMVEREYPGRILLCEANQWPEDVRPYFGDGDEFHMGFHFPIMPRLYMALKKEHWEDLAAILARTPSIPADCQWCIFLRNHDELTLEMVTEAERQWMWQVYAPEERMRLNLGIRRRLAPLLDNDRRKIEVLNSILFTLPGSPILYYGDEIGMGDNIWLPDRNGVRTPMQWTSHPASGFSQADPEQFYAPIIDAAPYRPEQVNVADQQADPGSMYNTLRNMIAVRKQHPVFGRGKFEWAQCDNPSVLAYWRKRNQERVLVIHNLTGQLQTVKISIPHLAGVHPYDLLRDRLLPAIESTRLAVTLAPYRYLWLSI